MIISDKVKLEDFVGQSTVILDGHSMIRGILNSTNALMGEKVYSISMGRLAKGEPRAFVSFLEDDIKSICLSEIEDCGMITLEGDK